MEEQRVISFRRIIAQTCSSFTPTTPTPTKSLPSHNTASQPCSSSTMAPSSCRRRRSLLLFLVVLAVLLLSSAAKPKADKPNKKANAATTKKEQQQQKAKAQPQQQKKPQQQKAQQQKQQAKPQQKAKRETQAGDATMEDTKENRHYHATRVLQGTPLIETLEGLVQEAARVKGPEAAEVRQMRKRGWTEEGVVR